MRSEASPPLMTAAIFAMAGGERAAPEALPRPAERSDEQRTASVLKAHFRTVWRALRRFGIPAEAADDAAQEVFIIASQKLSEVQPGNELRFLYGVAVRVAANALRAQKTR